MPNARLSERAPFFAEVDVVAAGFSGARRLWGSDVSETGIFLQTTQPFRIGDRLSLRFDVDQHEVHVRAAEVMWVRPFEPVAVDGRLPGVGLKFIAVDPPARAAIRKLVAPALSDTQPEMDAMPELEPADLFPKSSLPPRNTGKIEVTDEMLAMSLPPFSQPPLNISLPEDEPLGMPEEVRVFKQTKPFGSPKPVTIGPKPVSTPPNFLVGWTFAKASSPPAPAAEEDAGVDDGARFDIASDPPNRLKELEVGAISIREMPVLGERRPAPPKRRRASLSGARPLQLALGLLLAGTVVGSGLGFIGKKLSHQRPPAPTHAVAQAAPPPQAAPAPQAVASVADVERGLPRQPLDEGAAKATGAPAKAEAKAEAPAKGAAHDAATPAPGDAQGPATAAKAQVRVGEARVVKTFALAQPVRVVVDLDGGKLPHGTLSPGDGIAKIRFGHPNKDTGRVVFELDGDKKPRDLSATVDGGVLAVNWH